MASVDFPANYITALAAQPNIAAMSNATIYVFGGGFIGSIASPGTHPNFDNEYCGNELLRRLSGIERDSATFSFYRNPYGPATGAITNAWDTAFFVQPGTPYSESGGTISVPASQQFRMISALGGYIFPIESVPWTDNSPRQGDFVLQTGRVEDEHDCRLTILNDFQFPNPF